MNAFYCYQCDCEWWMLLLKAIYLKPFWPYLFETPWISTSLHHDGHRPGRAHHPVSLIRSLPASCYHRVARIVFSINKSDCVILLIKTFLWLSFEIRIKYKLYLCQQISTLHQPGYVSHFTSTIAPLFTLTQSPNVTSLSGSNQIHSYFVTFYASSGPLMSWLFLYFGVIHKCHCSRGHTSEQLRSYLLSHLAVYFIHGIYQKAFFSLVVSFVLSVFRKNM